MSSVGDRVNRFDFNNKQMCVDALKELAAEVCRNTSTTGIAIAYGGIGSDDHFFNFGTVHKRSNSEVTSETLFDIQSITKVIATAALVDVFQRRGQLLADDLVSQYLPELRTRAATHLSIKHLLLHQSGISDDDFLSEYSSTAEFWRAMLSPELHFDPGTSIEYSDVGYRLLGRVLEKIGGVNLDLLCKRLVWDPLGMSCTTYEVSNFSTERIAGHGDSWGVVDDSQDRFLGQPLGCDGVFSTTKDLSLFCRSMLRQIDSHVSPVFFLSAGNVCKERNFFESLGIGRKVFGWEQHSSRQSYLGAKHTSLALEKAGGAGAFVCLRPDKHDFFIYLTNHGRPNPFSMESWNLLVTSLQPQSFAQLVLS